MKVARVTTQAVTATLKGAGFLGAINTRRQRRSGFHVTKRNAFMVGVTFYDWENTGDQWPAILDALTGAGWVIAMGFGEDMITGAEALETARANGACMVVKAV